MSDDWRTLRVVIQVRVSDKVYGENDLRHDIECALVHASRREPIIMLPARAKSKIEVKSYSKTRAAERRASTSSKNVSRIHQLLTELSALVSQIEDRGD